LYEKGKGREGYSTSIMYRTMRRKTTAADDGRAGSGCSGVNRRGERERVREGRERGKRAKWDVPNEQCRIDLVILQ